LQLELAAPLHEVAGRQFDALLNRPLSVSHERADVASTHVALDRDEPLVVLARDLARADDFSMAASSSSGTLMPPGPPPGRG
jgi:hypothetical protein